jgi:diguanylate cyclase (GGDEF)-like protein
MVKWHLEQPRVPVSGAILALLALGVPVLGSTVFANAATEFESLLWISALIPAFLLAYYRGWRGVAVGFAIAMVVLTATQLVILTQGTRLPNWPLMLGITGTFIGISLLLGGVVEQLHDARAEAERLALFDALTSLPNRRYFDLLFAKSFAAARRGAPLVLVAFDIDYFKDLNDERGHKVGDDLLRYIAGVLAANTREMDLSARVGGDEFMSILAANTVEGALVYVDRVRTAILGDNGIGVPVTVSVGVALYTPDMATGEDLMAAADRALYRAKRGGRNSVAIAGAESETGEHSVPV